MLASSFLFHWTWSSSASGPDVRWSLLHLGDVYLKFKSLKFAYHLGSEEDLVLSLPKEIQVHLCSCVDKVASVVSSSLRPHGM